MQPAKPPDEVKGAFDDAIKAREDKERLENKAEAYANQILPQARGEAARIVADALAYKDKVIAEAEGEGARFLAVLAEFEKAPEVTRERLYLETVQDVLGNSGKVIIDVDQGNSLMYLPLDRLISRGPGSSDGMSAGGDDNESQQDRASEPLRDVTRGRRVR
jgi:membrane protease subunit HflK